MIPIVTPDEMAQVDAAADEPVEVLIERAGAAVAKAAVTMLGGTYGRTVVVVAGGGNNGADGRVAADRLRERGVRVIELHPAAMPDRLPPADLLIDAAFGTGYRPSPARLWRPPESSVRVLAVDVPSGVDAMTGSIGANTPWTADRTVTFGALKPGLLIGEGARRAGTVEVVPLGLDTSGATAWLAERSDVVQWLPRRDSDAHKWRAAVCVVAGSAGMFGAGMLTVGAAQRAGAGMVRWGIPGSPTPLMPMEAVGVRLPDREWFAAALKAGERCHSLIVGPGLGRSEATVASVRELLAASPLPAVVDGDGLFALAWGAGELGDLVERRSAPTILTPHDGEYAALTGGPVGDDRMEAVRELADRTGAIVLLKGPVTLIAEPSGEVIAMNHGDTRLATAGSGDVLSGILGALLAQSDGSDDHAWQLTAAGAYLHAEAARHAEPAGVVASDLVERIPAALAALR